MTRLRAGHVRRGSRDQGFTLIELLVVVVIIGILIAIAIPVYLNYQKGAHDKAAQSDVRSTIGILQQCANDNGAFPTLAYAGTVPAGYQFVACTGFTSVFTGEAYLSYFSSPGNTPDSFILAMSETGGSGKTYCFASATGGSITTTATPVTAYRTACGR